MHVLLVDPMGHELVTEDGASQRVFELENGMEFVFESNMWYYVVVYQENGSGHAHWGDFVAEIGFEKITSE